MSPKVRTWLICNTAIILVFFLLLGILPYSEEAKKTPTVYSAKVTEVECKLNPTLSKNYTCKLKPGVNDRSGLSITVHLLRPVKKSMIHIQLFKYTNQFRPFLIDITINVCKWLDNRKNYNAYATIILNLMTRYTNVNHSCPYSGVIRAEAVYYEPRLAYFMMPVGRYMLDFTFFNDAPYELWGAVKIMVDISEEGKNAKSPPRKKKFIKIWNKV